MAQSGRCAILALVLWAVAVAAPAEEGAHAVLGVRKMATLSSEVNYMVKAVRFEMGQTFDTGEVLIEFDDTLSRANLQSAEAALAAATASYNAVDSLYESSSASLVERESTRRDMEQARARLVAVRSELDACVVRAPFPGRVAEVYVNAHELVSRGVKLMTIVDDRELLAKFLLVEDEFGDVRIGDAVDVFVPAVGERTTGVVTHVAAVMDPASRTFDVWASVDNGDGRLRAGMIARLSGFGGKGAE